MIDKLYWVEFRQNNSGGYFIRNGEVSDVVFIQGKSVGDIEDISEGILSPHSDYCECCGGRWRTWVDESDLTGEPTNYYTNIKDSLSLFEGEGYATLHYRNGDVRYVKQHENNYSEILECPEEVL